MKTKRLGQIGEELRKNFFLDRQISTISDFQKITQIKFELFLPYCRVYALLSSFCNPNFF